MPKLGDVLSYLEMCGDVGVNLQRGMNFRLRGTTSVVLMSLRTGAPYADRIEAGGRILIYEGHDIGRTRGGPDPKKVDQPEFFPGGGFTQNGLFAQAVRNYKQGGQSELIRVYEKIRAGIWVYNGLFELLDYWLEDVEDRKVFKFKLHLLESDNSQAPYIASLSDDNRIIPSAVKLEVWKRDKGQCVTCGRKSNLHFDHIIPYSRGGSSRDAKNIQILCGMHNLEKHDQIM